MSNSIETAIAIAFFGTIAIGIAIAKAIFQLLLLLLILLREFSNYCYCYWYCALPKVLLITSLFYKEVSASQTGLEGHIKDLCGLKQSNVYLRVLLHP